MTNQNDNDDPNYKVGYRKPPLNSRFKKGQTGNPRGSKPKIELSRSMVQLRADFLSVTEQPITITLHGKRKTVTANQALMLKLWQQAMNGDKFFVKFYYQLQKEFMQDFTRANPEVTGMVETLHRHMSMQPDLPDAATIEQINKLHRKTRGLK
jgi:hypothetical protein